MARMGGDSAKCKSMLIKISVYEWLETWSNSKFNSTRYLQTSDKIIYSAQLDSQLFG